MPTPVKIYMYDISGGMARTVSGMLLGTQLEAIWHTSVVVYGREYFFSGGGGVLQAEPGTTTFGTPLREVDMGTTTRTEGDFALWNSEQNRTTFAGDNYNLLTRNCNHYTDAALRYLVGRGTPDDVSQLPSRVLQSPMGSMIRQFFEAMQASIAAQMQQSGGPTPAGAQQQQRRGYSSGEREEPLDGSGGTSAPTRLFGGQQQQQQPRGQPAASGRPTGPKFFCHMCDREVSTEMHGGMRRCVTCKEAFLEELEDEEGPAAGADEQQRQQQQDRTGTPNPLEALIAALSGGQPIRPEENPLGAMMQGVARLLRELPARFRESAQGLPETRMAQLPRAAVAASAVGEECAVCQETYAMGSEVITLPCRHFFHTDCIKSWLRVSRTCPTCRHQL